MNCTTIGEFLSSKYPKLIFGCNGDTYENISFESPNYPSKDVFLNEYEIWINEKPLRLLRQVRNQLLTQTDWRMTTDYPYNDQADWASYRTQLRNLPQTANPTLDENGNLIVDWPQAPSDS